MVAIEEEVKYNPPNRLKVVAEDGSNLKEYSEFHSRYNMEKLYLTAFRHNMSLNEKGLLDNFIHVISVDRLMLLIAEEFLEHDMIRMFDTMKLFKRITVWQLLTSSMALYLMYIDVVFGANPVLNVPNQERCKADWYGNWLRSISTDIDKHDESPEVIDLMPFVLIYVTIHLLDFAAVSIFNHGLLFSYIEFWKFDRLDKNKQWWARLYYWLQATVRTIAAISLLAYVESKRSC